MLGSMQKFSLIVSLAKPHMANDAIPCLDMNIQDDAFTIERMTDRLAKKKPR